MDNSTDEFESNIKKYEISINKYSKAGDVITKLKQHMELNNKQCELLKELIDKEIQSIISTYTKDINIS